MSFFKTVYSAIRKMFRRRYGTVSDPPPHSERLIGHYIQLVDLYGSESPVARHFREEHRSDAHLVWLMSRVDAMRMQITRKSARSIFPKQLS